jgi:hypothetical protein
VRGHPRYPHLLLGLLTLSITRTHNHAYRSFAIFDFVLLPSSNYAILSASASNSQAADPYPYNPNDRQPDARADFSDLALAPFTQNNPQPDAARRRALHRYLRRSRPVTIFQHNSPPPDDQLLFIRALRNQYPVFFLVPVARVGQPVGQFPIIGQQN